MPRPARQGALEHYVGYYSRQQPSLGLEFAQEIYRCIDRICENPLAWTQVSRRLRRAIPQRFRHGVLYRVESDTIIIVAVTHFRRHPNVWRERD
jgi:plasmid stabilization system protein ParE